MKKEVLWTDEIMGGCLQGGGNDRGEKNERAYKRKGVQRAPELLASQVLTKEKGANEGRRRTAR